MKRKLAISLITALALLLNITATVLAYEPEYEGIMTIINKINSPQAVHVESFFKDNSTDELVTYNVELPKVFGLKNEVLQTKINEGITSRYKLLREDTRNNAKITKDMMEKNGYTFRGYGLYVQYDVKSTYPILSFTITTYVATGGTGNPIVDCYNIDVEKGIRLSLSDLFKENTGYKQYINEAISKEIEVRKQDNNTSFFSVKDGFTSIRDDQWFYIQGDSLVILFKKYEIAPGYVGTPDFYIPMSKIAQYMKYTYPLVQASYYFNNYVNYSFKLPPVWNNKVKIDEYYDSNGFREKTDFTYIQPEGEKVLLGSIIVVDNDKLDEFITDNNAIKYIKVAKTDVFSYLAIIGDITASKGNNITNEEANKLIAPFEGINDLFNLVSVSNKMSEFKNDEIFSAIIPSKIAVSGVILNNIKAIDDKNNEILLPLRAIAQSLGYKVFWTDDGDEIILMKGTDIIHLAIDDNIIQCNGKDVTLLNPPELYRSSTYVPIGFIRNVLNKEVYQGFDGIINIK